MLVLAFIPTGAAIYISSTRFSDFRHHGFDILFGSAMGLVLAWGSFRLFHMPLRRAGGASWGSRGSGMMGARGMGPGGAGEVV